jgi:multidrug efflux pump subunit AcrB
VKLVEFSVKHSLFVNLLSVFLVIAGLVSMFELRREAFPEVSFDMVTVTSAFRGASADEVEKFVTTPLEKELREVDNVKDIYSSSIDGVSNIFIEMSPDASDKRKIVDDIQKAVDRVVNLPEGVRDRPVVTEITSKQIPVIKIGVSGALDEFSLRKRADDLKERLENIEGVASVRRQGWRDEQFWVEPDVDKLREYHVSLEEIMTALREENVAIPAGRIEAKGEEFLVKTRGEFYTAEEIADTVIRANDAGNWLKIKDLANVRHTFEDEIETSRVEGTRAITLIVIKRENGDAIQIVDKVKKVMGAFETISPAELKLSSFYDLSYYIKRRLNVLRSNGIIAIFFVVGTLFLFLNPTSAIMTSLGIPVAMLTTFYVMNLMGLSINLITMFGLILVLGMVVDDGIIISENAYRYIEKGIKPREAVVRGASEVVAPVTATVLTTIAAFSPLIFMTGLLGKFISAIPLIIIIALGASVLEAFVILPTHLADFCKPVGEARLNKHKSESGWFHKLQKIYLKLLNSALNHRYIVVGVTIATLVFCIIMAAFFMPFILFSGRGVEQFYIRAEAPAGISLEQMKTYMEPVEEFASKIPEQYLDTYETSIGTMTEERGFDPNAQSASNLAQMTIYLTPAQQRKKTAEEIIDDLRPALDELHKKIPGLTKLYFRQHREGPPVGRAVDVRVRGEDYSVIKKISDEIFSYVKSLKGVKDVTDSYNLGNKELQVVVNKDMAAKASLTINQIASSMRNAIDGGVATAIKPTKAEEEIEVLVRFPSKNRDTLTVFNTLLVPNKFGDLVPLNKVARIEGSQGLRVRAHLDGKRFISVSAEVDNKNITSAKANSLVENEFKDITDKYPGYSLRFGGEQEETTRSIRSLLMAFWIALLMIFLILATQFNSLVQPFIVMLTIPFGMIGVIIAFLLHGEPLSFFAILGVVGLTGVVVNDSIVYVDFINRLRKEGLDRKHSIIQGGKLRLRPVILTTVTTIAGLSTVAYGIGGSDPFLKPMALAITWGLFFSTALTLIVMPCIYSILDDIVLKVRHRGTVVTSHNQ